MIRKLTFRKSFTGFKVSILREKQFKKFRTVSYYWKTPPRHRLLLFVYLSASELLLSLNCGADFCNPIPEGKEGLVCNTHWFVTSGPQKPGVSAVPWEVSPTLGFTQHRSNLICSPTVYSPIFHVYNSARVLPAAIPDSRCRQIMDRQL